VTQDDWLYRFRPRVFAFAAELGTVRAACRAMGIHPSTYCCWKRAAGPPRPGDPGAKPLPQRAAAEDRAGGDALSHPRRDRPPGRGHSCRYRALIFVGAYSGLRIGGLAGLRPSRVDLQAGAVTVAETLTEVKGKLIAGPPKTRAGRRTVGLPPFVVRELEAHLAAAQRPSSHIFTALGGKEAAGPGLSGAPLGASYRGSRRAGPAHPRPSPHRRGAVDRRRRDPQGGHRARGAHLGQLRPGPLWPPDDPWPVGEGRCHPVRD
jgi:integrase